VAAAVGYGQLVIAIHLLRGTQCELLRHAVLGGDRVAHHAIVIEHELRIDQRAVVPHQPLDAVAATALLVRRERENDVTARPVPLLFHAQECRGHDGIAALHVEHAAAVEVAVFFHELEGVGAPVLAPRLHHVEMPDEQHRPVLARAAQTHHQVLLALVGSGHDDVRRRKAGGEKALRHGLRGRRDVARGIGGVDPDQLPEELVCQLVGGGIRRLGAAVRGGRCARHQGGEQGGDGEAQGAEGHAGFLTTRVQLAVKRRR